MSTFKVILSLKENPDKFTFATISECDDMDDCINHIFQNFPDHQIEEIKLVTDDTD